MPDQLAAARLRRLREALADAPFDAFLATASENVQYATGYRAVGAAVWRTHRMAALVTGDDVWLVAPVADSAPAVDAGVPADRIVPFGTFYFEGAEGTPLDGMAGRHAGYAEALVAALRVLPAGTRLGVDGLDADAAAALPAGVVDAAEWIMRVRAQKLPGEIELLRTAARITEDAIDAALAEARPGSTERQIAATVAAAMAAGGMLPKFVVATTGPRSALADAYPTDRPWRHGELLRFDVGGTYEGTGRTSGVPRCWVSPTPSRPGPTRPCSRPRRNSSR